SVELMENPVLGSRLWFASATLRWRCAIASQIENSDYDARRYRKMPAGHQIPLAQSKASSAAGVRATETCQPSNERGRNRVLPAKLTPVRIALPCYPDHCLRKSEARHCETLRPRNHLAPPLPPAAR